MSQHTVFGAYAEFKSGEQLVELVGVHLTESQILDGHAKVKVTHQGIHGTIQFDLIDIGPQRLAFFAADFVGMLDNLSSPPYRLIHFGRESIVPRGNAGDVVAVSPRSAARSGYCSGVTWYFSTTASGVMCFKSLNDAPDTTL